MSKFSFDSITPQNLSDLKNGAVAIIPTDTVYGIVTKALNRGSVNRLYGLKNRINDPGTIIAANVQQILSVGVTSHFVEIAKRFWPNPISVVLPLDESMKYLHLGRGGIAFRVVADPEIAKLLEVTGPLLTTSANLPGESVVSTVVEAEKIFGNSVDFYIDGGDLSGAHASTVLKIDETGIHILRQGSIKV